MRIVQITDLHVGLEGQETFGTDVRGNFLDILELTRGINPDHVMVTGDLCYQNGDREIYAWIRDRLDALSLPYDLLSGNHDDPRLLAGVFGRNDQLIDGELCYTRPLGGHTLICLDTTTGVVSSRQLSWLEQQLDSQSGEIILFMHHPPLLSGVPHMDRKYALENRHEVQELFFSHSHPIHVFTGHYHVDKVIRCRNLSVYITPSCFFQIDQHHEEFRVDHRRPGLREISFRDGILMSTVRYVGM